MIFFCPDYFFKQRIIYLTIDVLHNVMTLTQSFLEKVRKNVKCKVHIFPIIHCLVVPTSRITGMYNCGLVFSVRWHNYANHLSGKAFIQLYISILDWLFTKSLFPKYLPVFFLYCRFPLFTAIHNICKGNLEVQKFMDCLKNHPEHM